MPGLWIRGGVRRWQLGTLLALVLGVCTSPVVAAPQKIAEFNEKGNFLLIGNTGGQDCRAGVPAPTVGTVGACSLSPVGPPDARIDDTSPDILWTSANGTASADANTTPGKAGTTAMLNIPAGAVVVHARLFWAGQLELGNTAGQRVQLDTPGGSSMRISADTALPGLVSVNNGRNYYQSTANITTQVQQSGSGAYRVGAIPTVSIVDVQDDVIFVNWHMIVVYRLPSEPTRNIVIYRGLDAVATGQTVTSSLDGFLVPNAGFDGNLGVIAYDGDDVLVGDAFAFNNIIKSNALNPAANFFNSTRSQLGNPVSVGGDLPQMSGQPGSMSGLDLDVIDVTTELKSGDTSATIKASTINDYYFLGGFVSSIATLFPVFSNSTKTFTNASRPGQPVQQGDLVTYTLNITNSGSDASVQTVLRDALPPQLLYIPGTLNITSGANQGQKTDMPGDDQAEYDPTTRTLTVRIGTGATAATGGAFAIGDTTVITFQAQVGRAVSGALVNQGVISALGAQALAKGVNRAGLWPTGDGNVQGAPTVFVTACQNDTQCGGNNPRCLRNLSPARCGCSADSDCLGGRVCDTISSSCVECTAAKTGLCSADGLGGLCLPDNTCGCAANSDCGSRTCDLGTLTCPSLHSDLTVVVLPPSAPSAPGMTAVFNVQITNLGVDPATGAPIQVALPPGVDPATLSYTCTATGGAVCPSASGSGPIPSTVTLPPGGQLLYMLSVPLPANYKSDGAPVRVTALPPSGTRDPNLNNNTGFGEAQVTVGHPDLSLTITGQPSVKVTFGDDYTAVVNNKGPADSPGAYFTVHSTGGVIRNVQPGDGWSCQLSSDSLTLYCSTANTIAAGGSANPVLFTIGTDPTTNLTQQSLDASVSPSDSTGLTLTDANPTDNSTSLTESLSATKVSGGGFGCTIAHRTESAAPLSSLAALLGVAFLIRRRRQQLAVRS